VTSDPASPFWQNAILFAAALFLLWEIFGGWRRGVIRSALHFGAFVVSGFLGFLAGKGVASLVGIILPGISFLAGLVVGVIVALLALGICLFLAAVLFKRTSQQPPGLVRWLFGFGGAFFGLLTGLFILWGGVSLVRASGSLAQANKNSASSNLLGTLKNSLEEGPLGGVVESVDILPTEAYTRLARVGELSKNPDAMVRFLDDPGVQEILAHPRMQAILDDPQVVQAAETQNYIVLLQSRTILAAATDPSLQKLVLSLDLQKALDHALPPTQNPATPKTTP
jgi:hypothetical protein